MRKTLLVMRNEIRATLRRRAFVIFALGLPLVMGLVAVGFGLANRGGATLPEDLTAPPPDESASATVQEGYVDPGALIQTLPQGLDPGWLDEYPSEAAAQAALDAGEIGGYYLIPADYVASGAITYVRQEYNPLRGELRTDELRWLLAANLLGDEALAARLRQPLQVEVTSLAPPEEGAAEENWLVELLPTLMAMILYMAIIIPAGTLVNAVTDEKKNRVMEVLMSSLSSEQMITGKVLALALLGLVQLALWLGTLVAVANFGGGALDVPPGFAVPNRLLLWSLVYGVLGYAMYGAQMAGVGALAPDVKDTRGASLVVLAPLILVYMFLTIIVINPDGLFAIVMSLFPLTSPVAMIARMTQTAVPAWQVVLAAGLQLLAAIGIVRLVARLFRAQYLLSGQPFSIGGFYRAMLGRAV
jgi:ABC-2 type transport system permease protein